MRAAGSTLQLSASDLSQFLGCRHRTALDMAVAAGQREAPTWVDPVLKILAERGLEHERAFVGSIVSQGLRCVDLNEFDGAEAATRTRAALRDGVQVIVQGALAEGRWFGRPDVLRRVETPSGLGKWSYEVIDTKLAIRTRGGTILQLALYCDLLGDVQGVTPESFFVITPHSRSPVQSYRTQDYLAYFRLVRRQLEEKTQEPPAALMAANYPDPVDHCEVCRWWRDCDERRRQDDHLSFVAGVSRLQRRELQGAGVQTLAQLAALPLPLPFKPKRGAVETFEQVREQARVQFEARIQGCLRHELLPLVPEHGLARLPEPSTGDVFLDIEGDPFVSNGGREYLFGLVRIDQDGATHATSHWAWSAAEERAAFEAVVDAIGRLWAENPGMHVYHYAPYEPSAFKRLMGRYASREDTIDRLLRAERFVDLHGVVRQAIRAGVESYSIKDLEPFYSFERTVALPQARRSLRVIEQTLELDMPGAAEPSAQADVEGYNLDDCHSALRLRTWLEALRTAAIKAGASIARPELREGAPSEKLGERAARAAALFTALTERLPTDPERRSPSEQAQWLAAQLLDWHRREAKAPWWEFFRLRDLTDDELTAERAAISGLRFLARTPNGTARCPVDRYTFPRQETEVRADHDTYLPGEDKPFGSVERIDRTAGLIDIKKTAAHADVHPPVLFAQKQIYGTQVLQDALFRMADDILVRGIEDDTHYAAARELLLRRPPKLRESNFEQHPDETAVDFAVRIAAGLNYTVLAIQGPPGAGKTFTGARMICSLVNQGVKVGVTAVSHEVIRNLLRTVLEIAEKSSTTVRCIHKVSEASADAGRLEEITDNKEIDKRIGTAREVIGGTQFLWAREEVHEALDVLFVDEAGQMSLANVLAASQCARSIVLLGDPQQLEQPQQGSHPDGAGVSALEHLLDGHKTIGAGRGIFLPETWRLPPTICAFTSEMFYESRLKPRAENERQRLVGTIPFAGEGLWLLPVSHEGNQNSSLEEALAIESLIKQLLGTGGTWTDRDGLIKPLGAKDFLVVAPYNAQVALLAERLVSSGVRVGTVDKFQGQEAPVVIYSMTTSSPEDAPRGMEFLYSLNRLNVATSRAQCACVLVANPRLFEPECRTPRQMQLANAVCRFREMATSVRLGPTSEPNR